MKILKTLTAVMALLFTFGVAESAMAARGTIYSVHLNRNAMSDNNTSTTLNFSVVNQLGADLTITNGGDTGKKSMVSSATVTLNGETLAGPKDFGKKVFTIDHIVDLDDDNELKVKISPCKNCELTITIIGEQVARTGNVGVKPSGQ
jgi:hypothetical protein